MFECVVGGVSFKRSNATTYGQTSIITESPINKDIISHQLHHLPSDSKSQLSGRPEGRVSTASRASCRLSTRAGCAAAVSRAPSIGGDYRPLRGPDRSQRRRRDKWWTRGGGRPPGALRWAAELRGTRPRDVCSVPRLEGVCLELNVHRGSQWQQEEPGCRRYTGTTFIVHD